MRRSASSGRDEGAVSPVDPNMALYRTAALGHPVGLGGLDLPPLYNARLADDIGGEDHPLAPHADDEEVEGPCHGFPSGPMAPDGQIWAQTPQPLQSSLMAALSSTISIAGQPNRTQVPQTVQASRSTA